MKNLRICLAFAIALSSTAALADVACPDISEPQAMELSAADLTSIAKACEMEAFAQSRKTHTTDNWTTTDGYIYGLRAAILLAYANKKSFPSH